MYCVLSCAHMHTHTHSHRLLLFPYILCYDWQMGSIPLVESLTDPRNLSSLLFLLCLLSLSYTSLFGSCSQRHRHTTIIGLSLLVVPFLPASNLFLRVGFVVAERILYISRSVSPCMFLMKGVHPQHLQYVGCCTYICVIQAGFKGQFGPLYIVTNKMCFCMQYG